MIAELAHAIWAVLALASPVTALLLLCYLIVAGAVALFGQRANRARRVRRAAGVPIPSQPD